MFRYFAAVVLLSMSLSGCRDGDKALDDYNTRSVTLPDGTVIRAEVMTKEADMMRGMMFRDSLPEGRGMMFIHGSAGRFPYWMYQVKVPLDIIWMDSRRRVVEVAPNAQPCQGKQRATDCPQYGGNEDAQLVLELPAGQAAKHGVRPGAVISF